MSALDYWEQRFTDHHLHHSDQNRQIATSFLDAILGGPRALGYSRFRQALQQDHILEVGCGTGELSARIAWAFHPKHLLATDLSPAAISAARDRYPFLEFDTYDVLTDTPPMTFNWDLVVCSNVLEHFIDSAAIIGRMLGFGKQVLALVPYRQPVTDDNRGEGHAGHVSTFAKATFKRWRLAESLIFETPGWQHSSKGERPQQLAVLIEPQ